MQTAIDSECSCPFPSVYFFLKVISRMDFSICCDKYCCPTLLCTVERGAAHSYENLKNKLQEVLQSIRKFLANKDIFLFLLELIDSDIQNFWLFDSLANVHCVFPCLYTMTVHTYKSML